MEGRRPPLPARCNTLRGLSRSAFSRERARGLVMAVQVPSCDRADPPSPPSRRPHQQLEDRPT